MEAPIKAKDLIILNISTKEAEAEFPNCGAQRMEGGR
jgi:hypothetical protein